MAAVPLRKPSISEVSSSCPVGLLGFPAITTSAPDFMAACDKISIFSLSPDAALKGKYSTSAPAARAERSYSLKEGTGRSTDLGRTVLRNR